MNGSIDSMMIYDNFREAAGAVCQSWCEQQGYSDRFYQDGSWWAFPPNSVMPVKIHDTIDLKQTFARRVRVKHYSIFLSIALLPDGCIAPHNHPEI